MITDLNVQELNISLLYKPEPMLLFTSLERVNIDDWDSQESLWPEVGEKKVIICLDHCLARDNLSSSECTVQ